MVDSGNCDGCGSVSDGVTFPTVWRVPAGDRLHSSNVREAGDTSESLVTFGVEAVCAITAGQAQGGQACIVVGCVIGSSNSEGGGSRGDERKDDGGELHYGFRMISSRIDIIVGVVRSE